MRFRKLLVYAVLFGIILGFASHYAWRQSAPVAHWLDARSITVADVMVGEEPTLVVDRRIIAPFHGEWIVTVRRLEPDGFLTYCTGTGENDYIPNAVLQKPLFLSRWMGKPRPLEPGQYRIDTRWSVYPPGYPVKERVISSNLFKVLPRP